MKTYRVQDPSGGWMPTKATSIRKARNNLFWRLKARGMYGPKARAWVEDTEEVKPPATVVSRPGSSFKRL